MGKNDDEMLKIIKHIEALTLKLHEVTVKKENLFHECQRRILLRENYDQCLEEMYEQIERMCSMQGFIIKAEHKKTLKFLEELVSNKKVK